MIETGFVPASGFLICFTFADTARITNGIATMDMGAVGEVKAAIIANATVVPRNAGN